MTAITVMTAASSRGMTDRGSGWPCRIARWLRTHSPYAATATTAPNTISGTPSTRRPQGTPGNGGSSWTTPRPDTTSASAVRLQARNVRSFAKVNRGSGSVPSSADPCGSVLATQHLQSSPEKSFQKALAIVGGSPLTHGSQLGASAKGAPGTSHQAFEPGAPGLAPAGAPSARPPQGRTDGHAPLVPGGRARKHCGAGLRSMERRRGRAPFGMNPGFSTFGRLVGLGVRAACRVGRGALVTRLSL